MAFADSEGAAARLLESLVEIAKTRGGIEPATMAAAGLPTRTVAVIDAARRQVDAMDVDDDVRAEVHRLIDLLSATGLFRR